MRKNQFILKAFAFTMAILLLGSTTGLALDMHYCGGEFQNFSLFSEAQSCHEIAMSHKACHGQKTAEKDDREDLLDKKKDDCCENESFFVQLDKDYIHDVNIDPEKNPSKSLSGAITSLNQGGDIYCVKFYKNYKPPLLDREIHIEIQSFLL